MAITLFNKVSVPVDNGSQAGPTVTFANPPVAGMQNGDLVFVVCSYRATTVTITNSASGGQTWSSGTNHQSTTATLTVRNFWCVFNGTWSAAPAFTVTTGTLGLTAYMFIFRPSSGTSFDTSTIISTAPSSISAPASPFDCFAQGTATSTVNLLEICGVCTDDDNTWGLADARGTFIGYVRNLQGNDTSIAGAYNLDDNPGALFRQLTLGGDPYVRWGFTIREFSAATAKRNYAIIIQ